MQNRRRQAPFSAMRTPERTAGQDREDGGEHRFLHMAPPFRSSVSERRTNKRTAVPSAETSTTPRPGKEDAEEDPSTGPEETVDSIASFMPLHPFATRARNGRRKRVRCATGSEHRRSERHPDMGKNDVSGYGNTVPQRTFASANPRTDSHETGKILLSRG